MQKLLGVKPASSEQSQRILQRIIKDLPVTRSEVWTVLIAHLGEITLNQVKWIVAYLHREDRPLRLSTVCRIMGKEPSRHTRFFDAITLECHLQAFPFRERLTRTSMRSVAEVLSYPFMPVSSLYALIAAGILEEKIGINLDTEGFRITPFGKLYRKTILDVFDERMKQKIDRNVVIVCSLTHDKTSVEIVDTVL